MDHTLRLATPIALTQQKWAEHTEPVVSILCATYNHKRFIGECIEGFLSQETTFPVEIIIRDDCSTDGTAEVVRSYAQLYPRLIKPILLHENQWSKGVKPMPDAFRYAAGDFIATCEGDDFWSSATKLQHQVDILEKETECVLMGGRVYVIRDNSSAPYAIEPGVPPEQLAAMGPVEMLSGIWYFRTLSRMCRRDIWEGYVNVVGDNAAGCDWLFVLYCISRSDMTPISFHCLDEIVGTYREHVGGCWFGANPDDKAASDIRVLTFALNNFSFGGMANTLEDILYGICRTHGINTTGVIGVDRRLNTTARADIASPKRSIFHCLLSCIKRW